MYELTVEKSFSAAHFLRNYDGDCKNMHGHNWRIELTVSVCRLNSIGIGVDFKEMKVILGSVLVKLDHKTINDYEPFDRINPTAENLARWIYEQVEARLCAGEITVSAVKVWESARASALYRAG